MGHVSPGTQAVDGSTPRGKGAAQPSTASVDVDAETLAVHRQYMAAALEEARAGLAEGGVPIGSVLVRDGRIIGRGRNRRVQRGDPMAHAEIDCLQNAGRQRTYRDTVLYSTLSPCYLCSGAAVQFGVPTVVIGEARTFAGAPDFLRQHGIEVINLDLPECYELMARFIRERPALWREDIGEY
jgi:cytosine deaminase